jgi:hypothetical protein
MGKIIIGVAACVLFGTLNLAAQGQQVFKGRICLDPGGRAPIIENGQPTLPCTVARPKRGSKYVLFNVDSKTLYQLDDLAKAKAFAGVDVFVSGILSTKTATIHVTDMIPALPSKITQARSIYIECDACPRQMAVAWSTAFQYLTEWGRFEIVADLRRADLVFLFSANQYGGDFLTRDGPDTRAVDVKITFMDIIDPSSGRSLWSDDRWWGSLFVAEATRDLLTEFKGHLAVSDSQDVQGLPVLVKNEDGKVSKQEFLKFMEAEFDRVDTDKDGYLNAGELKQLRLINVGK